MFSVVFEVRPAAGQREAYLGHAKMLRPDLERIDGSSTTSATAA